MLNILFKDESMLVVDKPVGVSVHNQDGDDNLISLLQGQFSGLQFYPVHRLDKETSGVQIFALNEKTAALLALAFQERKLEKKYVGVLCGSMLSDKGSWLQPLSDRSEGRKNPAGLSQDRIQCETRFQVLERSKYFTKCEFNLITGRQHQIRKHAVLNRHALVGDQRYGDLKYNQKIATIYGHARMFLHCQSIVMAQPILRFESQEPEEFSQVLISKTF